MRRISMAIKRSFKAGLRPRRPSVVSVQSGCGKMGVAVGVWAWEMVAEVAISLIK